MGKIGQIDRNFAVQSAVETNHLKFYSVRNEPFRLYGLLTESVQSPFCRIPGPVAQRVSPGVYGLHGNTAGGRLRFRTNSTKVAIRAKMPGKCLMPHMTFVGSSGFDLYVTDRGIYTYKGSFIPEVDRKGEFTSVLDLENREQKDIVIHFPLYDDVEDLWIGLEMDASLAEGLPYAQELPVIFYGSSITQGGCASRPGNAYTNLITQRLNLDHRNLGFSGCARGEPEMAEYIARQPMCLFFMDYDHNSPLEELREKHEAFYLTVREKNPELPILMASRTMIPRTKQMERDRDARRSVILNTYLNARNRGDQFVGFVDGLGVYRQAEKLGVSADSCTVDGIHPNDLGFGCMADAFSKEIAQMLNIRI